MSTVHDWAQVWGIPIVAVNDLLQHLGVGYETPQLGETDGMSETAIQNIIRLDAARHGVLLWRNNVGEMSDGFGARVRYGLCNDSQKLNKSIKSADLIGIAPLVIAYADVGRTVGQFVSVEVKHGSWRYVGDDHERAQRKWLDIVVSKGGRAEFATGPVTW